MYLVALVVGLAGRCVVSYLDENARVESLSEVSLCLAEQLSGEQYIRSGTITGDILLGGGGTGDDGGSRVLNLHLIEKNLTILGHLDLTGTTDQPETKKQATDGRVSMSTHVSCVYVCCSMISCRSIGCGCSLFALSLSLVSHLFRLTS